MAEDREHFYHYDCEGNLVFKEFKEMALRGGVIALLIRSGSKLSLASVSMLSFALRPFTFP